MREIIVMARFFGSSYFVQNFTRVTSFVTNPGLFLLNLEEGNKLKSPLFIRLQAGMLMFSQMVSSQRSFPI
ncbi:hypothetical protein BBD41_02390 [Paenibacillus ihbetae]|uniref:Uncharacterized protein n=1 Tax=Paenibacillus ihbetae TaxID=1870820 RepID=A0A1B2DUY4_9BACL|nr:hypothetical protein BBD41_02390 [Paenibacillus ihbetae]OOC61123.1 hypothetical protein BBD40_03975 [Paenibacillus ihbetae]